MEEVIRVKCSLKVYRGNVRVIGRKYMHSLCIFVKFRDAIFTRRDNPDDAYFIYPFRNDVTRFSEKSLKVNILYTGDQMTLQITLLSFFFPFFAPSQFSNISRRS